MAAGPWVMTCAGTRGDHLPFVGLARALRERGTASVLAVNAAMTPMVREAGLAAEVLGETYGPAQARALAWSYDHWRHPHAQADLDPGLVPVLAAQCRQLAELCRTRRARGLLAPAQVPHGRIAAELAGVDWHTVTLMPALLASDAEAPRNAARRALDERLAEHFDALRRAVGLAPLHAPPREHLVSRDGLLACSPAFYAPDRALFPGIEATGFWWVDDAAAHDWRTNRALLHLLAREPPPLVLTFSSLPLERPAAVLARYREAAALLGLPLLVLAGWSGFERVQQVATARGGPAVVVDGAPHAQVFARASAVICHGGIGTVGRALQAGRALLVEPYGNDQLFNALRVVQLGAGAAVHPHRATAEGTARALEAKVLASKTRENVARIASRMLTERGLEHACAWLRGRRRQASGRGRARLG